MQTSVQNNLIRIPSAKVFENALNDKPVTALRNIVEKFPFLFDHCYLAGGVCEYVSNAERQRRFFDVDLFFSSEEEMECIKSRLNGHLHFLRTGAFSLYYVLYFDRAHALSFDSSKFNLATAKVSECVLLNFVTFKYFDSLSNLLNSFDLSCCQVAFDGQDFIYYDTALTDIYLRTGALSSFVKRELDDCESQVNWRSVLSRIGKYKNRGYRFFKNEVELVERKVSEQTNDTSIIGYLSAFI